MTARLDPRAVAPEAMQGMAALEAQNRKGSLDRKLVELVKLRASQINGCAYCLELHVRTAREHGESDLRLHMLPAWRESSLYSDRERAALDWTEVLTRIAETQAPDADYAALRGVFSEREIVELSLVIATINAWNRLMIAFRVPHAVPKA